MPHTTAAYYFEGKVAEWAARLAYQMTGQHDSTFVMVFGSDDTVRVTLVPRRRGAELLKQERPLEGAEPYLVYDPFEAPEYCWLSWQGISQEVMERLIGKKFEEA